MSKSETELLKKPNGRRLFQARSKSTNLTSAHIVRAGGAVAALRANRSSLEFSNAGGFGLHNRPQIFSKVASLCPGVYLDSTLRAAIKRTGADPKIIYGVT